MPLSNEEFLRRYEQHILPKGFVKIRHYGYLKNYNKKARLDALFVKMNLPKRLAKIYIPVRVRMLEKYGRDISICPHCEKGKMVLVMTYRPVYKSTICAYSLASKQLESNKAPPNTKNSKA